MERKKRVTSHCELFESTKGWGCFHCEKPDCTYMGATDPIKVETLGKEPTTEMFFKRWDEEIAW